MPDILYSSPLGSVVLPAKDLVLVDREDGGNLIVNPPRDVWERGELTAEELVGWSYLVAATGRAMLDTLSVLDGGCIKYWEAGNWALNDAAPPAGRKLAPQHRRVHMHLLGRSPNAKSPSWIWGEAPRFPAYADRHDWARSFARLDAGECDGIVDRVVTILAVKYGVDSRS